MMQNDDLHMKINQYIDHTLVKPNATPDDIDLLCEEACQYKFYAVAVNPHFVKRCVERLSGTNIFIACAVGFPLGMMTSETKAFEANAAIADGAHELDMMINLGELKVGNDQYVEKDIRSVVDVARTSGAIVKVIIETCFLNTDEKIRACAIAQNAGADFVKTSTGFWPEGATEADVRLMAAASGKMKVKAAGGIRNWEIAKKMIEAGASRLGTSSGIEIVNAARTAELDSTVRTVHSESR